MATAPSALRRATLLAACATGLLALSPAHAILVMPSLATRYENQLVTGTGYQRYENLANQLRYENVGQLRISSPGAQTSAGHCSGTLVSLNIVLTAAHCLYNLDSGAPKFDPTSGSATTGYRLTQGEQMAFWTGPQIGQSAGIGYPTPNFTYAAYVDRVLPNPGFSMTSGLADIALVRLSTSAPFRGTLPTTFPTLSDSYADLGGPAPALANAVGYGGWGTGAIGELPNLAVVKRAAIVELTSASLSTPLLQATFYTPTQLQAKQYPSNFLQGATASGDSGGPLFYNFGLNPGRVVGVASHVDAVGPNEESGFGQVSVWTTVAPYKTWLDSVEPTLTAADAVLVAGFSANNPIMPQSTSTGPNGTVNQFALSVVDPAAPIFIDPVIGDAAEIHVSNGPLLSSVLLPASYGFNAGVMVYDEDAGAFVATSLTAIAGQWLDLPEPATAIRLLGDGSDEELVVGFRFDAPGAADLRWVTVVPEIPAQHMYLAGLLTLLAMRRARRRSV